MRGPTTSLTQRDRERIATAMANLGVPCAVSHAYAALLHGIELLYPPAGVTLTAARNASQPRPCGVLLRRADVEVVTIDGLPVTTALTTVIDLARALPFTEAAVVVDSALRQRLVSLAQLRQRVASLRGLGSAQARRVVAGADPKCGSVLETVARLLFIRAGVGVIRTQVQLPGHPHPYDYAVDGARVLIEVDGAETHRDVMRFRQDCLDGVIAQLQGFALLRFTWTDIVHRPDWVISVVRTVVAAQRRRLRGDLRRDRARQRRSALD